MSDRFTIVKRGGYDVSEVEQYITELETVIRGYKEKDNAINSALISAQIAANNIINDANKSAGVMKVGAIAKLDAIIASISVQRRKVKDFEDDYNKLVSKYLKEINGADTQSLYSKIQDLEEYIDGLTSENKPKQPEPIPEFEKMSTSIQNNLNGWL